MSVIKTGLRFEAKEWATKIDFAQMRYILNRPSYTGCANL